VVAKLLGRLLGAAVICILPTSCSMQDCSHQWFFQTIPLPVAVDSFDCTLTIEGPSGAVETYDVPVPDGLEGAPCTPAMGSYSIEDCGRSPGGSGYPQIIDIDILDSSDLAAFEQAVGGTTVHASVACGGISVLEGDPMSVTHYCAE
jgi:hypothetical protein